MVVTESCWKVVFLSKYREADQGLWENWIELNRRKFFGGCRRPETQDDDTKYLDIAPIKVFKLVKKGGTRTAQFECKPKSTC